jgi:DNA (cytosine-5)-methyltransferase 1
MTIGSLFTGYGGLDLAVEQALGERTVWTCDNDPGAAAVIAERFPKAPNLGDITTVDWSEVRRVDVLTAGWPCQPWSKPGKHRREDDHRALWPHVAEAVRLVRPRICLLENVANVTRAGELARAVKDLAAAGYVGSWLCLRAAEVGAPHARDRAFVLAWDARSPRRERGARAWLSSRLTLRPDPAPAGGGSPEVWGPYAAAVQRWERVIGRPAPPAVEAVRRLSPRFVEWMMGLPAGWVTDVAGLGRGAQLRLLGNGVVPQQAHLALGLLA